MDENNLKKLVIDNIKYYGELKGYTLEEISKKIGKPHDYFYKLIRDDNKTMNLSSIVKISNLLNLDIEILFMNIFR